MHAEKCPICDGDGLICDVEADELTGACPRYHICNGCQGKGWISVADTETEEEKETPDTPLSAVLPEVDEETPEFEGETYEDGEEAEEEPTESEFEGEEE